MIGLPERLIDARETKGLSKSDVARAFDVSPVTVLRWERGTREPSADTLVGLSKLYGVPVCDLLNAPHGVEEE